MSELIFYWELFLQTLLVAIAAGVVTMALVQKTKSLLPHFKFLKKKANVVTVYSFLINIGVGFYFSYIFTNATFIYAIWIGLLAFVGADQIYKVLEEKNLLQSFSELKNIKNAVSIDEVLEDKDSE